MKLLLAGSSLLGLLLLEPVRSAAGPLDPGARGAQGEVSIEDAAWLAGRWEGELFGGHAEEQWSAPADGAMMGMFRLIQGDRVGFYEFFLLREDEEHGLVLRLKHFHPDLRGWEEKDAWVEFPLVEATGDTLAFDGLVFHLAEPDRIEARLDLDQGGRIQTVEFEYRRVPDDA